MTGRKFDTLSGTLADHIALRVRGESFPGLVPRPGVTTEGTIYLDVDNDTVRVLDEFESGIYERVTLPVRTTKGEQLGCDVYRVHPDHHDCLLDEPWDFTQFRRDFLDDFIRRNIGGQV